MKLSKDFVEKVFKLVRYLSEVYQRLNKSGQEAIASELLVHLNELTSSISKAYNFQTPREYFMTISNLYRSGYHIYNLLSKVKDNLDIELDLRELRSFIEEVSKLTSSTHVSYRISKS